jgi:putative RNA 2'-phosphotransferase
MDAREIRKRSKLLSYILRHRPKKFGLELDRAGWVDVHLLLEALRCHGKLFSREDLLQVVATNDKQRFALSEDGRRIRANQGQSVPVDLGYGAVTPPETLFHGTVGEALASIRAKGLTRGRRHHVHLSETRETAVRVGQRRGKPIVLEVAAVAMSRDGHVFFRTPNGVWLTDRVPPDYLELLSG